MQAIGIDIGGTKIETKVFDASWTELACQRIATPTDYAGLVSAVASQIAWAEGQGATRVPVGICAPGRKDPKTGRLIAANLSANDQTFDQDIAAKVGRGITYINDAQALALAEAVFGAGRAHRSVMALVLGTGIGGGIVCDKRLRNGASGLQGEVGHIAAPAPLLSEFALPIWPCGCGRQGCYEVYTAGPGLQRLARYLTGKTASPSQIASARHSEMAKVWSVWCKLAGALVQTLTLTCDPDVVVLGGGLSRIDGVADDIAAAAQAAQIRGFAVPPVVIAQGGDTAGGRGAAYAARQGQGDG